MWPSTEKKSITMHFQRKRKMKSRVEWQVAPANAPLIWAIEFTTSLAPLVMESEARFQPLGRQFPCPVT